MTELKKSTQIIGLIGWLIITFIAAAIGTAASAESGLFYQQISRPEWAPPAWLFAPVWTALYILMGVSAWTVWRVDGFRSARIALSLFIIQLVLNAVWTWIFFVWRQGALAFVEILVLWAFILCTTIAFWRVRTIAGILLLPYLAWVSFASVLTFTVWRLNPLLLA
jgi:benzodiazapine receptor